MVDRVNVRYWGECRSNPLVITCNQFQPLTEVCPASENATISSERNGGAVLVSEEKMMEV